MQGDVSDEVRIVVVEWILPAFGDHAKGGKVYDIGRCVVFDELGDILRVLADVELVELEVGLGVCVEPAVGEVAVVWLEGAADAEDLPALFEGVTDKTRP